MDSDGCILVERKVAKMYDDSGENVANLTSIFYRNGYGGATILHSTLPSHKLDEWDRIPKRKGTRDQENKALFLRPHSYCSRGNTTRKRQLLWELMQNDIEIITEEQNVWEWFGARKVSLTASAACKYISMGLKQKDFSEKETWLNLDEYISSTANSKDLLLSVDELFPLLIEDGADVETGTFFSQEIFDDIDCQEWLKTDSNLIESLEGH